MKKNIFIVILAFLVVGLAGFIAYDNFLKPSTKCDVKETIKVENKEKTIDERYDDYLKNITKTIEKLDNEQNTSFKSDIDSAVFFISLNSKKELSIGFDTIKVNKASTKVADDAINYFITDVGNGGYHNIFYLNSKGELYKASLEGALENNGTFNFEKTNYKNVIEVRSMLSVDENGIGGHTPMFIDIDGNKLTE